MAPCTSQSDPLHAAMQADCAEKLYLWLDTEPAKVNVDLEVGDMLRSAISKAATQPGSWIGCDGDGRCGATLACGAKAIGSEEGCIYTGMTDDPLCSFIDWGNVGHANMSFQQKAPPGFSNSPQKVKGSTRHNRKVKRSATVYYKDPEVQSAREKAVAGGGLSGYATVVIQQIPFQYTDIDLMEEINENGFDGKYDYFYLPGDPRSNWNRGFAFVNFSNASVAEEFYRRYTGQKFKQYEASTSKPLAVLPAEVQGFEECAACFYSSTTCSSRRKRPVFLRNVPAHVMDEAKWRRSHGMCSM